MKASLKTKITVKNLCDGFVYNQLGAAAVARY